MEGDTIHDGSGTPQPPNYQDHPDRPANPSPHQIGARDSYSTLLAQVGQVQQELQLARVVIKQLREDNDALQRHWETCQEQLITVQEKYKKKKEELLVATRRQLQADRKHEAFRESLSSELTARQKQLEDMQAKLVPQDLDLLRIKVQEELEEPHRMKVAELEGETRKFEGLYYSVRRIYEKERTEWSLFREQVKAAIDSDRVVFEHEVAELNARLKGANDQLKAADKHESTIVDLRAEIAAGRVREQHQLAEINDLGAQLDRLHAEHDEHSSQLVDKHARLEADLAEMRADRHSQELVHRKALSNIQDLQQEVAKLTELNIDRVSELEQAKAQFATREKELAEQFKRSTKELDRRRSQIEAESASLHEALKGAKEQATSAKEASERAAQEWKEKTAQAMAAEEQTRADCRLAMDRALSDLRQAQENESAARVELKQSKFRFQDQLRQKDDEVGSCRAELKRAVRESEIRSLRFREVEAQVTTITKERDQRAKENEQLLNDLRCVQKKYDDAQAKLSETSQAEREAQALKEALRKDVELLDGALEQQRREHAQSLAELTAQHEDERRTLMMGAKQETESIRSKAAQDLRKEQKRASKYRTAAIKAHDTKKKLHETLAMERQARGPLVEVPVLRDRDPGQS